MIVPGQIFETTKLARKIRKVGLVPEVIKIYNIEN